MWCERVFAGMDTKASGFGARGSRTSMTLMPSLNMWPIKAWPLWTMTWVPSGRPPWSLRDRKLMFLAAAAVGLLCCSVKSVRPPRIAVPRPGRHDAESGPAVFVKRVSGGRRGNLVEAFLPSLRAELGDRVRRDAQHDCNAPEHCRDAVSGLDPQDGGENPGRHQAADTRGHTESGCTRVGGEHLGREDLHRIASDLVEEDHDEPGD